MDVTAIRSDFPVLQRRIDGNDLIYLDNAATTQKPRAVIDAVSRYYERSNANVHRSIHTLADEATAAYEQAHRDVADFIGADWREIVFTKNTTESLNLLAYTYRQRLGPDDEIVLTDMEHHSMLVPWQQVAEHTGATLRFIATNDDGTLDMEDLDETISDRTAVVGLVHVSNVLGTRNPVKTVAKKAHEHGAVCIVDGAQAAGHIPVDVNDLGCDFYAFSGHKMCAPMGTGVLWGRSELLESLDPFLYGGEMIARVEKQHSTWNELPWKFEAGTPNVAGAVGLSAAITYLEDIGLSAIEAHTRELCGQLVTAIEAAGAQHVGVPEPVGAVSFTADGVHPHDIASLLNEHGIAIRAGHHCAAPLHQQRGLSATARASPYLYNTAEEVAAFGERLADTIELFA